MQPESSIDVKLDYIQRDVAKINEKLDHEYVTKEEFMPVKNIVYGMVGVILLTVLGAIVALVIKAQP